MRNGIRLIALDLDGTLLNSRKELPPENEAALRCAAQSGVEIVPTTGRFYGAMPKCIRDLPYVHYVISVNGAQIYDFRNSRILGKAELPWQQAVEIMKYLDTLPVIYDCYMDNQAWMTRSLKEKIDEFAPDEHYRNMLHELRQPVEELKAFLAERKQDVQKIQLFLRDMALRERLLKELSDRFAQIIVSSSVVNNIEINHAEANKGRALRMLAEYLQIPAECTMAFGDGLNDLTMLRDAGIGVAMENAHPLVKAQADAVTASCDDLGVAKGIARFCFPDGI